MSLKKLKDLKNSVFEKITDFYLTTGFKFEKAIVALSGAFKELKVFLFGTDTITLSAIADVTKKVLSVILLFKTVNSFKGIGKGLEGIGDGFAGIGKGFNNIGKAIKQRAIAETLKTLTFLLIGIAGCLVIVSGIPAEDGIRSTHMIFGLLAGLALVMVAVNFLSGKVTGGIDYLSLMGGIALIMIALMILVDVINKIDETEYNNALQSVGMAVGLLLAMAVLIRVMSKVGGTSQLANAGALLTMVLALQKILVVIDEYKNLTLDTETILAIIKMVAMLFILAKALKTMTANIGKDGNAKGLAAAILAVAISLGIITKSIDKLGAMDSEQAWAGIARLAAILAALSLMLWIIEKGNKGGVVKKGDKQINAFKGLAIALLACVAAIYLMGKMDTNTLIQGGIGAVVLLGCLALILHEASKIKANKIGPILALLIGFGVLLGMAGIVIYQLSKNTDWQNSLGSAVALGVLLGVMSGVLSNLSKHRNQFKTIGKWVAGLALLGLVVGELAVILGLFNKFGGGSLGSTLETSAAISLLLFVMSEIMINMTRHYNKRTMEKFPAIVKNLALMGLVVGELALILGLFNKFGSGDTGNTLGNAAALCMMLGVLALVAIMLTKFGKVSKSNNVVKCIGLMAGLGLVVGELAAILYLIQGLDGKAAIPQVIALSGLLLAVGFIALLCGLLGKFGLSTVSSGAIAFAEVALILTGVIAAVGSIMAVIGELIALLEENTGIDAIACMDTAVEFFGKVGEAIGALVGGIVGGVMEGVTMGLPGMGESLSLFMINLQPFLTGLKLIDPDDLGKAAALAGIIFALELVSIINWISEVGTAGFASMHHLGKDLSKFMTNSETFFTGLKDIDESMVTNASNLAGALLALTGAALLDGLGRLIGFGSVDNAFDNLPKFGEAIVSFAESLNSMASEKGIDLEQVKLACEAGKLVSEMVGNLDPTGGLWQKLFGEKDLGKFSDNLADFGSAVVQFNNEVKGAEFSKDAIQLAVDCAKIVTTDLLPTLQDESVIAKLAGYTDLDKFSNNLVTFGSAVVDFNKTIKDNKPDKANFELATECAREITDNLIPNLPKTDLVSKVKDYQDLDDFSKNLVSFGQAIIDFDSAFKDNPINVGRFIVASEAGGYIAAIASSLEGVGLFEKTGFEDFTDNLKDFAKALVAFDKEVKDIDDTNTKVNYALDIAYSIADFLLSFNERLNGEELDYDTITDSIEELGEALKSFCDDIADIKSDDLLDNLEVFETLGSAMLSSLLDGFVEEDSEGEGTTLTDKVTSVGDGMIATLKEFDTDFYDQGELISSKLGEGIFGKRFNAINNIRSVINAVKSTASSYIQSFKDIGENYVDGLAQGIIDNISTAEDAAKQLAEAVAVATASTLKVESPSKVAFSIGNFFGIGLAKGIDNQVDAAATAGENLGESANAGLTSAISKITEWIDSGIDTSPVIRPVLDLSEVERGAKQLNTMFTYNNAMSAGAGIGSRYNSNSEIQNGFGFGTNGNSFNFTQNNYSPKALSRIDIYRQTKNQFTALKEAIQ